jgi:hypothetical protein
MEWLARLFGLPTIPDESPAPVAPRNPRLVRNIVPGTELHLGDGRSLAFGEEAEAGEELAATLRERGQAE